MAEKRMFAKCVVEGARFLKMPASSQSLYFHLCLNADDDGVVEAYTVMNIVKAHEDDLRMLCTKGFTIVLNEDLVTYITDWRIQNYIRADRKKDSVYKDLLNQVLPEVELLKRKDRSDLVKRTGLPGDSQMTDTCQTIAAQETANGPSGDSQMTDTCQTIACRETADGPSGDNRRSAQCSVDECSLNKSSIDECRTVPDTHAIKYCLDNESITVAQYTDLINKYPKRIVDGVIGRILKKPYHGCLNIPKISSWCEEQAGKTDYTVSEEKKSILHEQIMKIVSVKAGV